jgi:hypothetical protein
MKTVRRRRQKAQSGKEISVDFALFAFFVSTPLSVREPILLTCE